MDERFTLFTGQQYFEEEAQKYEQDALQEERQTGFLQKWLEEKIQEQFEKRATQRESEINYLQMQMESITSRLEVLEKQQTGLEEAIEIRDIDMPQIKKEMLSLLSDKKTRYADEIAAELRVDIRDVIEAFKQLKNEKKLFIDDDNI